MSSFYSVKELKEIGFTNLGSNLKISKLCRFYNITGSIGNGTRIDDFTILKGHFEIGEKVHICSHCSLSAVGGKITISSLSGIGVNNIFYTASDDMFKNGLCGPLVTKSSSKLKTGNIFIGQGAALGGRVTVMPGVYVGEYSAFGISTVLTEKYDSFSIFMNVKGKLKKIAKRDKIKLSKLGQIELLKNN
tara:strand:+ start:3511 stop:4080 length:570 start_codon:yes stop_codon:yes gene_type:complete